MLDPEPEVEDDGDEEKGEEETEHLELVCLALIGGTAAAAAGCLKKEANTTRHGLRGQGCRKCCSAVALLRAEQGPCEPSKGFVSKFGEPERA